MQQRNFLKNHLTLDIGDERQKPKMSPLYLIMDSWVYDIDTNQIAVRKGKKDKFQWQGIRC